MFAVFAKLTGDEEMPRLEQLRPRSLPLPGWRKRPGRKGRTATGAGAPGTRPRALLLIPVMLLVLAPAVLVGLATRSQSPCGSAIRPPHAVPALSPPNTCPPKSQIHVHPRLPGYTTPLTTVGLAGRPDGWPVWVGAAGAHV